MSSEKSRDKITAFTADGDDAQNRLEWNAYRIKVSAKAHEAKLLNTLKLGGMYSHIWMALTGADTR